MSDDLLRLDGQSSVLFGRPECLRQARETVVRLAEEDGYRVNNLAMLPNPKPVIERILRLVEGRLRKNPRLEPWPGDDRSLYLIADPALYSMANISDVRASLSAAMRLTAYTGVALVVEHLTSLRSEYEGVRHVEVSWRGQARAIR